MSSETTTGNGTPLVSPPTLVDKSIALWAGILAPCTFLFIQQCIVGLLLIFASGVIGDLIYAAARVTWKILHGESLADYPSLFHFPLVPNFLSGRTTFDWHSLHWYFNLLTFAIAFVLATIVVVLFHGAYVDVALGKIRGLQADVAGSLRRALLRLPALYGVSILALAAIIPLAPFLLLPAFASAANLFVIVPVCMDETLAPFASIQRSTSLTDGHRREIIPVIVIAVIGAIVVAGGLYMAKPVHPPFLVNQMWWAAIYAVFFVFEVFVAAASALAYERLRESEPT